MNRLNPVIRQKIATFFSQFAPVSFQPGHILIQSEQDPTGIFYLQQGEVLQVTTLFSGDRLTVNQYDSDTFFPMIWALGRLSTPPTINRHEFITVTEVVGCWAPVETVMAWLRTEPDVLWDLTVRLSRGFDMTLAKWEESHQSPATHLVGNVLVRHARRFGIHQADGQVMVKLTHQDMADQAGVTRETASRILSEFVQASVLKTGYRKVYIPDLAQLEKWLKNKLKSISL